MLLWVTTEFFAIQPRWFSGIYSRGGAGPAKTGGRKATNCLFFATIENSLKDSEFANVLR